jgi:hypothetical protein
MAAPHISGLAALAAAAHGAQDVVAIQQYLKKAAIKFPDVPADEQGFRMVDGGRLVTPSSAEAELAASAAR